MKKSGITFLILSAALLALAGFNSCKKAQPLNPLETLEQSPKLSATDDYASKHGVNTELAQLGRVLFYDKNLSLNNTTSCGSCHKQQFAFADNVRFNKGFNGLELNRNSPSIQGIRGFRSSLTTLFVNGTTIIDGKDSKPTKANQVPVRLFWDGRQTSVADMVLNPVTNHKEMNMPDFETLIKKLNSISYYPNLFEKAYGDKTITTERIALAMQGFMACLNTSDFSKTRVANQAPPTTITRAGVTLSFSSKLTPLEQDGLFLFHAKYNCGQCHRPISNDQTIPVPSGGGGYGGVSSGNGDNGTRIDFEPQFAPTFFNGPIMANIGLDETTKDKGLSGVTGMAGDEGLFKIPTLHNISVTAPYMHDGRYATLNEVLDHYSHNIKNNPNLSPVFKNTDGTVKGLNISPAEKIALIAFLNTLTDFDFLTSPMYSDPFN